MLLTTDYAGKLQPVEGVADPLSNAQKSINLQEAECSETWLEIKKKKRDLGRGEKIVEVMC